jgi:hypothetical protein
MRDKWARVVKAGKKGDANLEQVEADYRFMLMPPIETPRRGWGVRPVQQPTGPAEWGVAEWGNVQRP